MSVRVYRSSDTGAPALSGSAGALITVLDAVLVGSGGIAYGSTSSSGWTKPSLGGTNPGTNVSVYQQGSGSNGFYLRVNDSGAAVGADESGGGANTRAARLRGYESMTGVSTGTLAFPTTAQDTAGLCPRKAANLSTVPVGWIILADSRTVYMFILTGDTAGVYQAWMFGEFYSLKTSDNYRCAIISRPNGSEGGGGSETLDLITHLPSGASSGHYIARDASGGGSGSVAALKVGFGAARPTVTSIALGANSSGNVSMRNPSDHYLYLVPVRICHTVGGNTVRGRMRGMWDIGVSLNALSDGDTFTGTGGLAGKTFIIIKGTSNTGAYCMEISDTWDTN